MEFKVFKNENSKILKEYWLTQSEWDALDKTTVQEGDIYHIVGTIDKGDLSADVNASLAKADSSLQKPTATLAKESFVKVGIDGTQKFDESSYVVAPSTGGTAGQVLKKTATGTEWADESGGGGGKLYKHTINIQFADSDYTNEYLIRFVVYATTSEIADTISKFKNLYDGQTPTCIIDTKGGDTVGVGYLTNLLYDSSYPELHGYLGSWTPVNTAFPNIYIDDTVTEL